MEPGSPDQTATLSESWCVRFHRAGSVKDVVDFLASFPETTLEEICSVLLTDQQLRWSDEPGPRVEEYLLHFPRLAEHGSLLLDLAYGEARARAKLGFAVDADHYQQRFPSIAEPLSKQLELADWIHAPSVPERLPSLPHYPAVAKGMARRFGNYELVKQIARGGMGIVYEARQDSPRRIVALKMLSSDRLFSAEDVQRFKNETTAVSQLEHPGILPVFDVGESEGVPYFTSRLIKHGTLSDHVQSLCRDLASVVRIVQCLALAIHHAHERGVLHRDIKPSNVLIDEEGRVYVTDFGLAKLIHASGDLTHTGELMGTPAWISPEQAAGHAGAATIFSDVYGIGAVLYYLLTGCPPFEGNSPVDVLARVRESAPRPPLLLNPKIGSDLNMICQKAMDRDPARRYASADALHQDLERFRQGLPVLARPLPWLEHRKRQIFRHPVLSAVTAVLALAVTTMLCLITVFMIREGQMNETLATSVRNAQNANVDADRLRADSVRMRAAAVELQSNALLAQRDAIRARDSSEQLLYAAHLQSAAEAISLNDARSAEVNLHECERSAESTDLRGFEWFWLKRLIEIPVSETDSMMDNPRCMSYSPDGRLLAVGDSSGFIATFDAMTMDQVVMWETQHDMAQSISFSPSGQLLATGGENGAICVWTPENGKLVHRFKLPGKSSRAHFIDDIHLVATDQSDLLFIIDMFQKSVTEINAELGKVYDVAAYPEERLFAAIGKTGVGIRQLGLEGVVCFIELFDVPTRQSLQFSCNGKQIAFRDDERSIQVWSFAFKGTSNLLFWERFLDEPRGIAFSRRGGRFAVGDGAGGLHTWLIDNSQSETEFRPASPVRWQSRESRVNAVAISPTTNGILSATKDGSLRLWQPDFFEPVTTISQEFHPSSPFGDLSFAPNSTLLAMSSEHGIQLLNTSTHSCTRIGDERQRTEMVAFSPDGRYVASGSKSDTIVELWEDPTNSNEPKWRREKQSCDQLVFSPDCKLLTVVDWNGDQVVILNSATGELVTQLPSPQCWAAAFAPDGLHLAIGQLDDVQIWDCSTWSRHQLLQGNLSSTTSVAYSPDGRWVASGSKDRTIRIWDAMTGQQAHRMLGHSNRVISIQFSPDGKSLVSAGREGTIKVWHVATGEFLCDLWTSSTSLPFSTTFATDGSRLAARLHDGQVLLFDTSRSVRTQSPGQH